MIFTSGTQALQGRTVNHDPHPYAYFVGKSADATLTLVNGFEMHGLYDPRPEFAVLDNPILAQLRGEHAIWMAWRDDSRFMGQGLAWRARNMLGGLDRDWKADFTEKQIHHARRVLSRLATLTKGN